MSLEIFDAPTILPSAFLTGEMVRETTIRLPFLRCLTVSQNVDALTTPQPS
jgi:hypothetical protein